MRSCYRVEKAHRFAEGSTGNTEKSINKGGFFVYLICGDETEKIY
jgi:hypothetical protein